MIRKNLALLLSFVLLATQTGLAVSVHYCGGEAVSIAAGFGVTAHGCGMEPKEADGCGPDLKLGRKGCCDEKSIQIKVKQEAPTILKSGFATDAIFTTPSEIVSPFASTVPVALYRMPAFHCEAHGPPLFLLYSSYLLYA